MIYCLMFSGKPLDDTIRAILFDTAQKMFLEKCDYKDVKKRFCEGYVMTSWARSSMGGISGVVFTSHLETERGDTTVEYIVREADIKGADLGWLEEEPLYPIHLN